MSDKFYNDIDGAGQTVARKLKERLGSETDGFRTAIISDGDTTTMMRTKGGRPQITQTKRQAVQAATPEVCVKSPLVEIAFKYSVALDESAGVGPAGYRRWYGEPDSALPVSESNPKAVPQFDWSSDGLLCIPTRKIQKMRFRDANDQAVDFIFAKKPVETAEPAGESASFEDAAAANATAAGAASRFKFVEGEYSQRDWYPPERVNVDWITESVGGAVTYLAQRLRKLRLLFSDATTPEAPKKAITWAFAAPTAPSITDGADETACANQDGREVSFSARSFFPTNGHMNKARLRTGVNWTGKVIRLDFKRPGGFITAVDPESIAPPGGTPVTTHPGAEQGADLMDFKAFGNQYHGLVWWPTSGTQTFYKDSTRTEAWPFQAQIPNTLLKPLYFILNYYNPFKKDAESPDYVTTIRENDEEISERYYKDAVIVDGQWNVKAANVADFSKLQYNEVLYKDPSGTVWVIRWSWVTTVSGPNWVHDTTLMLKRRYGEIGTDFSFASSEVLDIALGTYRVVTLSDRDASYRVKGGEYMTGAAWGFYMANLEPALAFAQELVSALVATFDGTGNLDEDAGPIGTGISASIEAVTPPRMERTVVNTTIPDTPSLAASTRLSGNLVCANGSSSYFLDQNVEFVTTPRDELVNNTITYISPLDIISNGDSWHFLVTKMAAKLESHSASHSATVGHITPSAACVGGFPEISHEYTAPVYTSEKSRTWSCTRSLLLNGESLHTVTTNFRIVTSQESSISLATNAVTFVSGSVVRDNPSTPAGWEYTGAIENQGFVRGLTNMPRIRIGSEWEFDYAGDIAFALISGPNPGPYVTKLCYRHGTVDVAENLLRPCKASDGSLLVSAPVNGDLNAGVGWAYDFRSKELITVPRGTVAYFV